jgi:hypothetical protein
MDKYQHNHSIEHRIMNTTLQLDIAAGNSTDAKRETIGNQAGW